MRGGNLIWSLSCAGLALATGVWAQAGGGSAPLTVRYPAPDRQPIASIAWTGNRYAAVGAYGTIMTSPDGIEWTPRSSGTHFSLNSIAWSGSRLVATGCVPGGYQVYVRDDQRCVAMTSSDGTDWSPSLAAPSLTAVVWTGSHFVAVGRAGNAAASYVSADGAAWTVAGSAAVTPTRMVWAGNQIIGTGGSGLVATSPDGSTWTSRNAGISSFTTINGLAWTGSQAFMTATTYGLLSSPDGAAWAPIAGSPSLTSLAWTGTRLVGDAGPGRIARSVSGTDWDTVSVPVAVSLAMQRAGGQTFAFGSGGALLSSPDGLEWTLRRPSRPEPELLAVTWNGSLFVAVGREGAIVTSADGVDWTPRVSGTTGFLWAVTWTGDQLVAVGSANSTVANNTGIILTSPDGVAWTSRVSGTTNRLLAVAGRPNRIVAVGDSGAIRTSADGVIWTSATIQTAGFPEYWFLRSVAVNDSLFVAVGDQGLVLRSRDGLTWTGDRHTPAMTPENPNLADNLGYVGWSEGRFIVRGRKTYVSSNGEGWIDDTSTALSRFPNGSQAWNGTRFVSVGAGGAIMTAPGIPTAPAAIQGSSARAPIPGFEIHLTRGLLRAEVPAFLRSPSSRATLYSAVGARMTEPAAPHGDRFLISIGGLPRGIYLLEIREGSTRVTRAFAIAR